MKTIHSFVLCVSLLFLVLPSGCNERSAPTDIATSSSKDESETTASHTSQNEETCLNKKVLEYRESQKRNNEDEAVNVALLDEFRVSCDEEEQGDQSSVIPALDPKTESLELIHQLLAIPTEHLPNTQRCNLAGNSIRKSVEVFDTIAGNIVAVSKARGREFPQDWDHLRQSIYLSIDGLYLKPPFGCTEVRAGIDARIGPGGVKKK